MTPLLRKLQKLVRLAKDQEGKPEGLAAAEIARRLMAEHALSTADLAAEPAQHTPIDVDARVLWHCVLLEHVATHTNCVSHMLPGTSEGVALSGREADIEVATYLYTVLAREVDKSKREYLRALPTWFSPTDKRKASASFTASAVAAIGLRLREIRTRHEQEAPHEAAMLLYRAPDRTPAGVKAEEVNLAGYRAGKAIPLHDAVPAASDPQRIT